MAEESSVSRMKKTSITLMPPIAAITAAVLTTRASISGSARSRQAGAGTPVPTVAVTVRRPPRRVRSSRPAPTSAR